MENQKERQHFRPLAPDLQTYRPTLTMTMSIVHRATGIALYVGFIGMAAWLTALAGGTRPYEAMQQVLGSWVGLPILVAFTWAILHHVRIPTLSGRAFQPEAGHRSDVKPATIPINIRPL